MSDGFETVAISYSQPEAAVMMSFLAWHGIDAYALSEHARTDMGLVTALGGIPVRVHWTLIDEARALLADVTPPTPWTPPPPRRGLWFKVKAVGCFLLGSPPPPPVRAELR
ncbi:hypothetical protein [Sphingomonas sp.]|uniref:hypothetical protein n=1 Tax=Sphingomonas sp. TaxID=28214 RepID=UPI003B00BC6F